MLCFLFGLLSLGIGLAFGGVAWGRFLAFGAFGAIFLWATSREEAGWRASTKRRLRFWRTHFRPPGRAPRTSGAPGSAAAPRRETPLVHRSQQAQRDHVPTYATAHGLLYVLIVLVLFCGAAWVLSTLLRG